MGKYMSKTEIIYRTMLVYASYYNFKFDVTTTEDVIKQMFYDLTLLAEEYGTDLNYEDINTNAVLKKVSPTLNELE